MNHGGVDDEDEVQQAVGSEQGPFLTVRFGVRCALGMRDVGPEQGLAPNVLTCNFLFDSILSTSPDTITLPLQ